MTWSENTRSKANGPRADFSSGGADIAHRPQFILVYRISTLVNQTNKKAAFFRIVLPETRP